MSTLLAHYAAARAAIVESLADKRISIAEAGRIGFAVVETAACVVPKLTDKTKLGELITEAEQLYDEIVAHLKATDTDGDLIPGVPRILEPYALRLGRQVIRPALTGLADKLDGVNMSAVADKIMESAEQ